MDADRPTRIYQAAGGIVVHEGQALLLRRSSRNEVHLPKGRVEPGEKAYEAALREVREETGYASLRIVHDLGAQLVEFDNPRDGYHYLRLEHYFIMALDDEEPFDRPPQDEQFSSWWTPLTEAVLLLTFESERDVARRALAWMTAMSDNSVG